MAEIVIAEFMDEGAIASLTASFEVRFAPDLHAHREALGHALADARALIVRNRTQVDTELLDAAPQLRVIGRLGVGLDNIDLEACRSRGIEVLPATGANTEAVAEYVIGAALLLVRGAFRATDEVAGGTWPRERLIGGELAGRRLGLVGLGGIARRVARKALTLGMSVGAYDPYVRKGEQAWEGVVHAATLEDLVAPADVLSVHVPLSEGTRHLIDSQLIAAMKQGAILINGARGGIVDEEALAVALRSGHLGGAALDVFATEPLDAAAGARFKDLPNLLLTPHIAGITAESNVRVSRVTAENVRQVLERERTVR